ncbi:oligosaccharyl transferase subunit ost3/OST6 [Boothiomyces sp. JEL0866]|nr:oligosaccharyl transferase subunit ost3/OST6 [Boothiomyces sp. JEL0866]KAJ3325229.1 oligosaccharyl transferase subunit ost3/OST6 [Boothiomyces sp. JEL0866]
MDTQLHERTPEISKEEGFLAACYSISFATVRQFTPEYKLVAEGWKKAKESGKMYFGIVDYKNAQPIFQKYKISNVPVVFRFPPTEGPMKIKEEYDTYDIQNNGFSAERLADYVNGRYKTNIAVQRPIDYTPIITKAIGLLAVLALGRVFYKYVGAILSFQSLWIAIVLGTTVVMCSGYMWNTIRTPPFLANQNGQIGYIAGGFQNQFGVETVIVALLYSIISFALVAMTDQLPALPAGSQRVFLYTTMAMFFVTYSVLLMVFRAKNGAYPFKLFF